MSVLEQRDREFFRENGFLIIDSGISETVLDQVIADMDPYWSGVKPKRVSQADRRRIQDAWRISRSVKSLATSPKILGVLGALFGAKPLPFQTLNFPKGTQQETHSDSVHFNSEPFGMMCGVWIALEDIGPDQGPLIYYPGSHRLAEANYREAGVEAGLENYGGYLGFVEETIEREGLREELGILKKGQALVWAANLLHGGSKQNDLSLSRHSQVTHYYFEGCKYWRPHMSEEERYYFEPRWIPYPGDGKRAYRLLKPLKRMKRYVFGK
ncbi:MAG: phytanoyl-CoA dioxygenase family protein [Verrucomicrobiota bacterium]